MAQDTSEHNSTLMIVAVFRCLSIQVNTIQQTASVKPASYSFDNGSCGRGWGGGGGAGVTMPHSFPSPPFSCPFLLPCLFLCTYLRFCRCLSMRVTDCQKYVNICYRVCLFVCLFASLFCLLVCLNQWQIRDPFSPNGT